MIDNDYTIAAVIKALKTLKQFDADHKSMTLTELSNRCDINKSSMFRIINSLESEGFLKYDKETRKYKLGVVVFHLGNNAFDFLDIKKVCAPVLKKAAVESQLLVHLAVLEEDQVIVIDKIWPTEHSDMIALVSNIGGTVPLHCTGVGKILSAYSNEETREKLLAKCKFEVYSTKTINNREAFMTELNNVRRQEYALNDCEHEPYLRCVTRPIFDSEGKVIAAVSLSGLRDIIVDDKIAQFESILHKATNELSIEFGFSRLKK